MKKYLYLLLLFIAITLISCNTNQNDFKLLKVTERSSTKMSDSSFIKILKAKENIDLTIDYTLSEDKALKELTDKNVDLVIIPNNATSKDMRIKAIIPLLPRILMILTNNNVEGKSLKEILENGNIYFEDRSRLDSLFFDKLFNNFNVNQGKIKELTEFSVNEKSDSLQVYIGLTHIQNPLIKKMIRNDWSFFSLDDIDNFGKGSKVEGFTMMNMSVKPFIIPSSIFKGKPENSVLTVSINDILITRDDISNDMIYVLTRTIYNNRSRLIQMNPVYNLLDFNYDRQDLSFPLHKGTIRFLDRNEPPVWSKYVKMIWPLISISVVLFGVIASLRQMLKRRKKQNIEQYYNSLLEIRDKAESAQDTDSFVALLQELRKLRSNAMKSLANKKLDSGESFNIFLALFNDTKTDLIDSLRELRLESQEKKT